MEKVDSKWEDTAAELSSTRQSLGDFLPILAFALSGAGMAPHPIRLKSLLPEAPSKVLKNSLRLQFKITMPIDDGGN
jgi:hypothetical protein